MKLSTAVGGLAGAAALSLIDQGMHNIDKHAPALDLLSRNAVAKIAKPRLPVLKSGFPLALGGDLVSNSLYFAMAKGNTAQQTLLRGALLGLGAGVGAVVIPQRLVTGSSSPVNPPMKKKILTVAWYVIGGLVAAATINLLESRESRP